MSTITRLTWDKIRDYELGLDRGVLYPTNGPGEPWNGLTSVTESLIDVDTQIGYLDGVKTNRRSRVGDFSGTIEAFTYPEPFPKTFGLSYRVNSAMGYKIHLVYNVLVTPSSFNYQQSDTDSFSWDFTTKPIPIPDARLSAHLVVDGSQAYSWAVSALEEILYGNSIQEARLPLPAEVIDLFEVNSIVRVIDNGDGTFTVSGPDSIVKMVDETSFQINWPSAVYIDEATYTITSL